MARLDIDRVSPGSQAILFGLLAREHPENLRLTLVLGQALVRDSRGAEGIAVLESALRRHPDSPEAWNAWLAGLYGAYQFDRLVEEFGRLPKAMADDPRFAEHEGMVARERARLAAARSGRSAAPPRMSLITASSGIASAPLRQVGDTAELERVNRWYTSFEDAFRRMRPAYEQALAVPDLGVSPHSELYHRLADLRERMGRPDEARAGHQLVLRDDPANPISQPALERLK